MNRQEPVNEAYLPLFFRANSSGRKIAVTVDDCDDIENLRRIIRIFERCGAGLTLFPIGYTFSLPGMPDLLRHCVFEKGYEIENHTMNHARIFRLPETEMAREIWEQGSELDRILGISYRQRFFRLMGGDGITDRRTHNYLDQLGFAGIAGWSCCGSDMDSERIRNQLCSGTVFLFHTTDGDVRKLEEFLPFAVSRGYRPVALNELFGFAPNETGPYRARVMPAPRAYEEDYRTCSLGDYTWNTRRMQERLMALNLLEIDDGRPTGYYGKLTAAAVRRFQELQGLPATGVADAATQKRLLCPDSGREAR